jgi:hypothetical protein
MLTGHWTTPVWPTEGLITEWAPEAIYYQPHNGGLFDGSIWLFFKYPQSGGKFPEGTMQFSFRPEKNGKMTSPSIPVHLHQTRVPNGTYVPY